MLLFGAALLSVLASTATADVEKDEGVHILTDKNFDDFLKENDHVMVKFYAPWCGHCKALAPTYAKAAAALVEEKSSMVLAKLDATVETEVASRMEVQGYPTLKFFVKGKAMDYSGERSVDALINFMKKKSGPPATRIDSIETLNALKEKHPVVAVVLTENEQSVIGQNFYKVASALLDDSIVCAIVDKSSENHAAIFKECGVESDKEAIVLFKHFDEGRVYLDNSASLSDEDLVRDFILHNSIPLVVEFNQETAQKIFGGSIKNHLILFASYKDSDKYQELKKETQAVAAEFKGKVIFVTINVDEPDHERISEFFGMSKETPIGMRLIHLEEDMAKYKPENEELTGSSMRSFVQDFLDGKLKQHLLSEEVADDWDALPVKKLAGKNFKEVAYSVDKHVIVMFHAPWCGHCKALAPVWDELGQKFEGRDDVVVAKLDSTANELEDVKIQGFPTIKMFAKGDNKVIDYNGERTLDALTKFIESDGVEGAGGDDADDEEDEEEDLGDEGGADEKDEL